MKWNLSGLGEWFARWPNFKPQEFACHHCGELPPILDVELLDRLQLLRTAIGKPLRVNSGYRCRLHNAEVKGSAYSQHKSLAVDLSLAGLDAKRLYALSLELGFLGVGLGETFIHLDMRRKIDGYQPPRVLTIWHYSEEGKKKWQEYLKSSSDQSLV